MRFSRNQIIGAIVMAALLVIVTIARALIKTYY